MFPGHPFIITGIIVIIGTGIERPSPIAGSALES
jgi:hypothetical protein